MKHQNTMYDSTLYSNRQRLDFDIKYRLGLIRPKVFIASK